MVKSRELDKLLKRLRSADPRQRDLAAAELGDLVEFDALDAKQYQKAMEIMLPLALAESDPDARESMFNTLSGATPADRFQTVDWSSLAQALEHVSPDCLEYALVILEFSGESKFIPRIRPFLAHSDPIVREAAAGAIKALESPRVSRIARAN